MKKVKIVYTRDNCIGATVCVNLDSKHWVMNKADAKANLIGGKLQGDKWILETELTQEVQMAAEQCPAGVIEVYDLESDEKLF